MDQEQGQADLDPILPGTLSGRPEAAVDSEEPIEQLFAVVVPPIDLTSDMLLAAALLPSGPLRRAFPGVPFLSLLGHTPVVMWFSRIKEICYAGPDGERKCAGGKDAGLYNELTVLALLRRFAVFSPGIYATSRITIWAGHGYGMPKRPTVMNLSVQGRRFASQLEDGDRRTFVAARLVSSGKRLGRLLSMLWPMRVWPVRFPSGTHVRALIRATPRAQLARLRRGRLALAEPWLPRSIPLLRLGLYLPDQLMQLPPPWRPDGEPVDRDTAAPETERS